MTTPHPRLHTPDGIDLPLHHWPADPAAPGGPRGSAVVVHGLGEHIGRQAVVARHLAAQGFEVFGVDQRGHGAAGGPRGGIPRDDSLLADLAGVIDHARAQVDGPLLLLGHSLGGLVAARFVAEALQPQPAAWSRPVDSLVLSSPALRADLNPVQRLLLATVARLLPGLAVDNGLRAEWLSHDPQVVADYRADPLVHGRITGRLARFVAGGGRQVLAAAGRWQVPTLLLWAGEDRCVAPAGSVAFAEAAPVAVVTAREWPQMRHEIFNEPGHGQVLATITQWLALVPPLRRAA